MKWGKWGLIAGATGLVGLVGFVLFRQYAIGLPGLINDWRSPIQATQPVSWAGKDTDALPGSRQESADIAAGSQDGSRREGSPRPPNIVLILADDLGWNDVSYHAENQVDASGPGARRATVATPNIDALAASGVRFSNGYAAHSSCAPSRAALLSGRYGTRFGFEFTPTPSAMGRVVARLHDADPANLHKTWVPENTSDIEPPAFEDMVMPTDEITIAELLRDRGYHTMHIGKWHLGDSNGAGPLEQGFDESLYMASGKYLPDDDPDAVNSQQDFDPIDKFLWANFRHAVTWAGGPRFHPDGYLTDYFTDQAVAAIEANRDRPFFLYLAHWAPHSPLQALKSDYDALGHITNHRERVYAAMIRALDRGIGRVMTALREQGLDDNTLVIFTSDNGGAGYIGLPEINQPYRGWKLTFFEGGIHVPFLMRWPAGFAGDRTVDQPVHHFDIYATAAAAAGATLPTDRRMDGTNLLPWLRAERSDAPHETLFWRSGHYQAVRAGHWKLQRAERPDQRWLFDLASDPTEHHDVAAAHPDIVADLVARLDAHNAEQPPPAWPALAELPVLIDKTSADPQDPADAYVYVPN